jgi:hypothetical protein
MLPPITGTAQILDGQDFVRPPGPPHTYIGMARSFFVGAEVLGQENPSTAISLAFVAAQAAECALKAFLSRTGDDQPLKEKHRLRHDLAALWELAREEGLLLPAEQPQWLVTLAHLHRSPYYIRYSTGVHGIVTPGPQPMLGELRSLIEQVGSQLGIP